MPGARGKVGPSLSDLAGRVYIGGSLTNGSANLVRWLINPRAVNERSAMPVTGISEAEARIVTAYLLSKR